MQAARGTSLSDTASAPSTSAPRRGRLRALFAIAALVCLALDQVTKALAVQHLTDQPDVQVVGELLQLHLTYNPGAAFSLGTEFTYVFSAAATIATVVVLWLARRLGSPLWALALGVLLAGITGNLADRLFREPGPLRGHVVDFLMVPNWPIFNIADVCINVAAVLIVVQAFRGVRLDGTREQEGEQ